MDKYEYKLKLDQLKSLYAEEKYAEAAQVADEINWKKVRNANTLCMVGDIYEKQGRYDACRDVLLQAYDHSPIGRTIVSKLAQVAIEAKQVDEAEEYYNEFLGIAPQDNMRYILAYQISCLKEAPLTDRIAILEELKEQEYTEKWAYELAALYSQADMRDKCVESCDELILWFGEGEYVEKAMDLKRKYQPLTPAQEEKYQKFREDAGMVEISLPKKTEDLSVTDRLPKITVTASKFNTMNLQEELANSMRQIMNATEKETVSDTMDSIKKLVGDIPYLQAEPEEEPAFDKEKINEQVDETLKVDFQERLDQKQNENFKSLLGEEQDGQMSLQVPEQKVSETQIEGQMSIEDVLAEWERTKQAAEEAIAAAEQKKLEMAKETALSEAGEIMERLKALIPLLSATPGEDLPQEEDTVAAALVPDAPKQEEAQTAAGEEAAAETSETEIAAETSETEIAMEASETESAAEIAETEVTAEPAGAETAAETAGEQAAAESAGGADGSVFSDPEAAAGISEAETVPEAISETPESLSATKEMPDISIHRGVPAGESETESMAGASSYTIPKEKRSAEDEELERILAQGTQVMAENANVEVAVEGERERAAAAEDIVPEVRMPEDLIPANKPVFVGKLNDEQRELFSYFLPVPGMEEQICQILMGASERAGTTVTSLTGNILIQGEEGSGKTVLATSLIKAHQKVVGKETAKIGKISAAALNRKDFAMLIPKMAGGYLIVDKAGDLTAATAARMSQVMEQNTQGLVVLLEDTKQGIKHAMSLDFGFAKKFTEKINIPIFTIDELVDFGKSYAEEMECTIDEMGVLALYNRINNIQKLDRPTTLAEVKDIVDEAIENAEGTGLKKAFGAFFSKKYNENDYLILREKDFEV